MKIIRSLLAYTCLLILSPGAYAADHDHDHDDSKLKVMTQNLYVGADMQRIVMAEVPEQIPLLVGQTFAIIDGSDFPSRARSFAQQVKEQSPDVIGLQEVSLIRVQAQSDYFLGNPTLATEVRHDYLSDVMAALADQGLHYKVAGVVNNIDQELPAFGSLDGSNIPSLYDVRLTDRDVILVRERVRVTEVMPYNYSLNLVYHSEAAGDIEYLRGAIGITARIRGEDYRIFNTHLEVRYNDQAAVYQAYQAQELQALLANESRTTVVIGDFNSDPRYGPDAVYGLPSPYQQMLLAGYSDSWLLGGQGNGLTCCRNETLDNFDQQLSERIDYVFVRPAPGYPATQPIKARVELLSDITEGGIWYSDHEGLSAWLKLPATDHDRDRQRKHH